MNNTVEKVIEMPQIIFEHDILKVHKIVYELINMAFEILISFVPIFLYWLLFYLSNTEVDYFEHIKNGSIVWIFLTILVMGNFKTLISEQRKNGFAQRLIVSFIIIFMLLLLGIYLILNFSTYDLVNITLAQKNTTLMVVLLGISTIIINILRIIYF